GGFDPAVFSREGEATGLVPAAPFTPQADVYALVFEPRQPCPQERGGLERAREYPAAGADEGRLAQALGPRDEVRRREAREDRPHPRGRLAIATDEAVEVFRMGEVQATAAGHQELPPKAGRPL